jgi:integrase
MAGRRPLTEFEERRLLRIVRRLEPRNRALVTTEWFTGFRVSEVLSLTVGSVWRDGRFLPRIGTQPRHLKGGYGTTRYVPILPELQRALDCHLRSLRRLSDLFPSLPLFPSRQHSQGVRAITRVQAHSIIKSAFAAAGIENDGRLGTHTLRKTVARSVYISSGNDLMVLKAALNHSSVMVIPMYLDVGEDAVVAAIARCDFTKGPRQGRAVPPPRPAALPEPISAAA